MRPLARPAGRGELHRFLVLLVSGRAGSLFLVVPDRVGQGKDCASRLALMVCSFSRGAIRSGPVPSAFWVPPPAR